MYTILSTLDDIVVLEINLLIRFLCSDASGTLEQKFENRGAGDVSSINVLMNKGVPSTDPTAKPTVMHLNDEVAKHNSSTSHRRLPMTDMTPSPHTMARKPPPPFVSNGQGMSRSQCRDAMVNNFEPLSQSAVERVQKFVFFAGYPRSGHSMIGSVMDAHPNMVIAHEYFLLVKCVKLRNMKTNIFSNKAELFNSLYEDSFFASKCGWRSDKNRGKGYNFNLNSKWQGTFSQLKVIGDKSGGSTSQFISKREGKLCLQQMIHSFEIPIIAMHVVRNPYDMIATALAYRKKNVKRIHWTKHVKQNVSVQLQMTFSRAVLKLADSVVEVKKYVPVVEVHIEDFIDNPSKIIVELCHSLGVDCPQEYVEECTAKAYRNVSRTRDVISWSPSVLSFIDQKMTEYPFFEGYTFKDDYRQVK